MMDDIIIAALPLYYHGKSIALWKSDPHKQLLAFITGHLSLMKKRSRTPNYEA